MSVLGVFALVLPVMLLLTAVVALASHGPVGVLAAIVLVVVVLFVARVVVRRMRAWWRTSAR